MEHFLFRSCGLLGPRVLRIFYGAKPLADFEAMVQGTVCKALWWDRGYPVGQSQLPAMQQGMLLAHPEDIQGAQSGCCMALDPLHLLARCGTTVLLQACARKEPTSK